MALCVTPDNRSCINTFNSEDNGSSICIVVMCGLPASGKTSFCRRIKGFLCDNKSDTPQTHVIHVQYDELIPNNINFTAPSEAGSQKEAGKSSSTASVWKTYRQHIVTTVGSALDYLHGPWETGGSSYVGPWCQDDGTHEHTDPTLNNISIKVNRTIAESCSCFDLTAVKKDRQFLKHVFLIDDIMFYRSMRHSYFKLAKKYETGFVEILMECEFEEAVKINRERSGSVVSDETMGTIRDSLQPPDPVLGEISWEKYTLVVHRGAESGSTTMEDVRRLVNIAINDPVRISDDEKQNSELKEYCRFVCSTNFIHRADKCLRNCIRDRMKKITSNDNRQAGFDPEKTATDLNDKRRIILECLRCGEAKTALFLHQHKNHFISNSTGDSNNEMIWDDDNSKKFIAEWFTDITKEPP